MDPDPRGETWRGQRRQRQMDPLLLKDDQEIDARCCDIAEGQGDSSWQAFRSYVGHFL